MRAGARRFLVRVRDQWQGYLDESLAFIHLPKCAGTSLRNAISRCYPASRVTHLRSGESKLSAEFLDTHLLTYRRGLLVYELICGQNAGRGRFLTGHYPIDPEICGRWSADWNFITVLREPVSRWLSHYFYAHKSDSPFSIQESLEEFVESDRGRGVGKLYLNHLGGLDEQESTDARVEAACRTLDEMALVGTIEDYARFADGFQSRFGRPLKIARANANPVSRSRQEQEVTPAIRRKIEDLCHADRLIYDYAMGRCEAAVSS